MLALASTSTTMLRPSNRFAALRGSPSAKRKQRQERELEQERQEAASAAENSDVASLSRRDALPDLRERNGDRSAPQLEDVEDDDRRAGEGADLEQRRERDAGEMNGAWG